MKTTKRVEELEAHLDHLQERFDNLRDDFSYMEDFIKIKLGGLIDDKLTAMEDYLNIDFVVEPKRNKYVKKQEPVERDLEKIRSTGEPLIKDEKIRKAVRAWADANGRDLFRVINEHFNCCKIIGYTDGGTAGCNKIEFSTTIAGADKNHYYTLTELCGEEE